MTRLRARGLCRGPARRSSTRSPSTRSPSTRATPRSRRLATAVAAGALVTGAVPGAALVVGAGPAAATHDPPPNRRIVGYTVRPGDTATGLAVRFHAWTAELVSTNHLDPRATLRVGQRLRIPVVPAAGRPGDGRRRRARPSPAGGHANQLAARTGSPARYAVAGRSWPARQRVRRVIAGTARRHGVDPQLALAVSWQEAGWKMHHVSSTGAVGAMQVLPATGDWMELYADRRLRLRRLQDNALAGVLLLRVLERMGAGPADRVAAYYQGLGAVRRDGWYADTRAYVANVRAIRNRLERGLAPG